MALATPVRSTLTARQIADRIVRLTGLDPLPGTVDCFKAGDPDTIVTGVASTFLATMDILRQASDRGLNFIVTHEPTFYNHTDNLAECREDPVVQAKLKFIAERRLVVWRFHDLPHRTWPDMIVTGMAELMGWPEPQYSPTRLALATIPTTSVAALAASLKQRTGARTVRMVGDPDLPCSRVAVLVGSPGHEALAEALRSEADVIAIGECSEWADMEYVRDAAAQGRKIAAIVLGHRNSEEPGVAWISRWLAHELRDVRVEHLLSADPFLTNAAHAG
jgi:putative NIF3 family GTP cyclohydrolase 1 type 2